MMRTRRAVVLGRLAAVGVLVATASGCSQARWTSELVTVDGRGSDAAGQLGGGAVFSPDGTKIAFATYASDLGPTDTNGTIDVYVRDLVERTTTLVSVNSSGTDSGNDYSWLPVFSPDGTKIAFDSGATDLHPIGAPGARGVYVRDLEAGTTVPVSVDSSGANLAPASGHSFSPDGTEVLFVTTANWLGPRDGNALEDVYLRDLAHGTTTLVSANAAGTDALGYSYDGVFSPDGATVVFEQATRGLLMRDLAARTTEVLAPDAADPVFSADGAMLAFTSASDDLGYPDTNGGHDAFVLDLATGAVTLVSVDRTGTGAGDAQSYAGWISPDGETVVFSSDASNLVATDTNGAGDVFVRDLSTGVTSLVSVDAEGDDSGNGSSSRPAVSPDGTRVAFVSSASDLGPRDTTLCTRYPPPPIPPNPYTVNCPDVYVRDLVKRTTTLVSANAEGTNSADEESTRGTFSPVSSNEIALETRAGNLGATDTNRDADVYLARLSNRPAAR